MDVEETPEEFEFKERGGMKPSKITMVTELPSAIPTSLGDAHSGIVFTGSVGAITGLFILGNCGNVICLAPSPGASWPAREFNVKNFKQVNLVVEIKEG